MNAPAINFIIQSTTVSPHASEVSDTKFNDHNIVPAAQYGVFVIPEPTTLALIGMTAVGGAFIARRRRVLKG